MFGRNKSYDVDAKQTVGTYVYESVVELTNRFVLESDERKNELLKLIQIGVRNKRGRSGQATVFARENFDRGQATLRRAACPRLSPREGSIVSSRADLAIMLSQTRPKILLSTASRNGLNLCRPLIGRLDNCTLLQRRRQPVPGNLFSFSGAKRARKSCRVRRYIGLIGSFQEMDEKVNVPGRAPSSSMEILLKKAQANER